MSNVEKAVANFAAGFNCCQSVLAAYSEQFGLSEEYACKVAAGFGGGMRMAETCGALTGAFMVIGLKYGATDAADQDTKKKTNKIIKDMTKRFRQRNRFVKCKELLKANISTPEGMKIATEKKLIKKMCPKMIRDAAELLEEILAEN